MKDLGSTIRTDNQDERRLVQHGFDSAKAKAIAVVRELADAEPLSSDRRLLLMKIVGKLEVISNT